MNAYSNVLKSVHALVDSYKGIQNALTNPVTQTWGNWSVKNNITFTATYRDKTQYTWHVDIDYMLAGIKGNSDAYHSGLRFGEIEHESPVDTCYNILGYQVAALISARVGSDIGGVRGDLVDSLLKSLKITKLDVIYHDWKSGGKTPPCEKIYPDSVIKGIIKLHLHYAKQIKSQPKVKVTKPITRSLPANKPSKKESVGKPAAL